MSASAVESSDGLDRYPSVEKVVRLGSRPLHIQFSRNAPRHAVLKRAWRPGTFAAEQLDARRPVFSSKHFFSALL